MGEPEILYKLALAAEVPADAWKTRMGWTTAFVGTQTTKYITLHTVDQLAAAAEASFAGKADVMVLSFTVDSMRDDGDLKIKLEDGEYRAYGGVMPYACLYNAPVMLTLDGGKHVFPPLGLAATAAAKAEADAAALKSQEEASENSMSDDGLEPFDQHRFDLDD